MIHSGIPFPGDKTLFVQGLIDDASVDGGTIELAPGWWPCDGQLTIHDCDYVTIQGPGRLVYAGAASPFIAINSTTYTSLDRLQVRYTNPAFEGVLIQTSAKGKRKQAVANLELNKCVLQGFKGATNAHALLDLDNNNIVRVLGCQFAACQRGVRLATNYGSAAVQVKVDGCSFLGCEAGAIVCFLGSVLESLSIEHCAFGPRADGRSSGITLNGPGLAVGVSVRDCWFGDRTADGGGPWVTVKARGIVLQGNRFGSAGNGPDDYAVRIVKGSTVTGDLHANVYDAKSVLVEA